MNTCRPTRLRTWIVAAIIASGLCVFATAQWLTPQRKADHKRVATSELDLLEAQHARNSEILSIRRDPLRNRVWVLTLADVYVYDSARDTPVHRVILPNWSVIDFHYALAPDLVLDRHGVAFVSNNVEPRLLEIEPSTFHTKEHQLRVVSRRQSETGFGPLRLASNGALIAVSATGHSVFKIDLREGTAREIDPDREDSAPAFCSPSTPVPSSFC